MGNCYAKPTKPTLKLTNFTGELILVRAGTAAPIRLTALEAKQQAQRLEARDTEERQFKFPVGTTMLAFYSKLNEWSLVNVGHLLPGNTWAVIADDFELTFG